jgi:hypothetical protein
MASSRAFSSDAHRRRDLGACFSGAADPQSTPG